MNPVQHLLALAERKRRKQQPLLAPATQPPASQPPRPLTTEAETACRHQRLQQAIVRAVCTGLELGLEERAELTRFAKVGMTEAETLTYLLRKYPAPRESTRGGWQPSETVSR